MSAKEQVSPGDLHFNFYLSHFVMLLISLQITTNEANPEKTFFLCTVIGLTFNLSSQNG